MWNSNLKNDKYNLLNSIILIFFYVSNVILGWYLSCKPLENSIF